MDALRKARLERLLRRVGPAALEAFAAPLLNVSQFLALAVSFVGTWIVLQTADTQEAYREVSSWFNAAEAFGYVMIAWAAYCLIRSPFLVVKRERELGVWRGNTFAYHQPQRVLTRHFFANGLTNNEIVLFKDAEPMSLARYSIEFEPPVTNRVSAAIFPGGPAPLQDPKDILIGGRGAVRLDMKREAFLSVRSQNDTVPVICRVYCQSFSIGGHEISEVDRIEPIG